MKDKIKQIGILILKVIISLAMILIFGIIGLVIGATIGGNYGCLAIIDSIFNMRGYESCGMFFSLVSMIFAIGLAIYVNIQISKK